MLGRAVRCISCDGSGKASDVIAALDWLAASVQLPAVASMSLGAGQPDAVLDAATNAIIGMGVTVVTAAGNYNNGAPGRGCGSSFRVYRIFMVPGYFRGFFGAGRCPPAPPRHGASPWSRPPATTTTVRLAAVAAAAQHPGSLSCAEGFHSCQRQGSSVRLWEGAIAEKGVLNHISVAWHSPA